MNIVKVLAFATLAMATRAAGGPVVVASPNGLVEFRLSPDAAGGLHYGARFKGRPVIDDSPIGITVDGVNLAAGAQLGAVETYRIEQKYPWRGVHSTAV